MSIVSHNVGSSFVGIVIGACAAVVVGIAAVVHPVVPFALVGLLLVLAALSRGPLVAMLLFLVVLLTRPADFFPALAAVQPAKMLALCAVGMWALAKALNRDDRVARLPHNRAMTALTIAIVLSSQLGTDRAASMAMFTDVFVKVIILWILITNLVDTPRRALILQIVLACTIAFLGALALHARIAGVDLVEGSRAGLVGLLGDPNDLALTLLMATPFSISAALSTRGPARVAFIVIAFLGLAGIVSTISRGGFLGLGSASWFLLRSRIKNPLVAGGIIAVGLVTILAVSGLTERKSGAVGEGEIDGSAQGRLDAWAAGGRMAIRHPIFGVGFGRFADNYLRFVQNAVDWRPKETHNSYVKALAETGAAGFVPFIALIVLGLRSCIRLRRLLPTATSPLEAALLSSCLPNLVGFLVSAFFLSQCWSWFIYIMCAQAAATERAFAGRAVP
jgi:putative inorganic carbon (HCO3(-)) transporter